MSLDIGTLVGRIMLEDDASAALKTFGKNLDKIGGALTDAGKTLTIGLTAPLVAAAGASLLFAGNFEASMTRLVSLAGVSQAELQGVKEHILDLAPAVGIGPQALADAMTKVSSTVSDADLALKILDSSARLSAAGMGTALDVAGALTAVINSYGKDNITAARAADILTQSVKDGGAEARELAPVLANVVPIAAQLGVSFEEVGANIATLTKLGVPASEAVTQLSSVFSAFLKKTKQGKEALQSVGLSYDSVRHSIADPKVGLASTLVDLTQRFGDNKTGLTDLFGRIEALRNVMSTAGQQAKTYAEVLDNVKHSSDGLGVAQEAFNVMQGKQLQTWAQVVAAVQVAAIKFGDALVPAMGAVLNVALPLLKAVGDLAGWFGKLPQPVQTVAIAVGGLLAAAGPLIYGLGAMVGAFSSLAPLIPIVGAALAVATGPIGLVALAVGGLVAAVVLFRQHMAELETQASTIGKPLEGLKDESGHAKIAIQDVDKAMLKVGGPTSSVLVNGMTLQIGSIKKATSAAAAHVTQTKEQIEAAEALRKKLNEIHKDWADAARDVGKLTDAQKLSIDAHLNLGHKVQDIALDMHLAEPAVADYAKEFDNLKKRIPEMVTEALKVRPVLEVMGFAEARKHVVNYDMSLHGMGEAAQETADLLESDLNPQLHETTTTIDDMMGPLDSLSTALGTLSNDFTQMSQIAGDSFGGPLRAMGEVIKTVEMVSKAIGTINVAMKSAQENGFNASNISTIAASWVSVAVGLYQYYEAIQGVIEAGKKANELKTLAFIADQLSINFHNAAGFSDQLVKSLREGDSIASHLTDIIKELGGASNLTAEQLNAVEGVLAGIIVSGTHAWKEIKNLDDGLLQLAQSSVTATGLVSQFFLQSISLAKQYGYELKSVNEFLLVQLGKGAEGLNQLLLGLQASALAGSQAHARAIGAMSEEQIKNMEKTFSVTAQQGAGLAAAIAADFAGMVQAGATFSEALDKLQPSISALSIALKSSGVDGGAAFKLLTDLSVIAHDAIMGPLVDAITGANKALMGLHNGGVLNQQMFTALEITAVDAYNKIIWGGGSAAAANLAIAPTLQTLWSLQKDFGYAVDDATQALIDEAVKVGDVGDKHRPIAEQMLIATQGIQTAVEGLAKVFGVILPASAKTAAKGINDELAKITIPTIPPIHAKIILDYDTSGAPGGGTGGGGGTTESSSFGGPWTPDDLFPTGERTITVNHEVSPIGSSSSRDQAIEDLRNDFITRLPNLLTSALKSARAA